MELGRIDDPKSVRGGSGFSSRSFLRPLARTNLVVLLVTILLALPNVLLRVAHGGDHPRFVPWIESIESIVTWFTLLGSFGLLVASVGRRTWTDLRPAERLGYAIGILSVQIMTVLLATIVLWATRADDSKDLRGTFTTPDGRPAYVYAGGLDCSYSVHVAKERFVSERVYDLDRHDCRAPVTIEWNADGDPGAIRLLDAEGNRLRREEHFAH